MGKRGDKRRQKELRPRNRTSIRAKQANQVMHRQRLLPTSGPKLGTPSPPKAQIPVPVHPATLRRTPSPQLTFSEALDRFLDGYRCPKCGSSTEDQDEGVYLCTKCDTAWTLEKVFALKTQLPP